MKKFVCLALATAIVLACAACLAAGKKESKNDAYLRVHIRANSNSEDDQRIKYLVRDSVVEYLAPTVSQCATKEQATARIGEQLPSLCAVAESVLRAHGFCYGARARLSSEQFPTRVYENVTLEAGVYDALILELGTGEGDNWWCVVYPPLCFTGGNAGVQYKSKIAEIIKKFFA